MRLTDTKSFYNFTRISVTSFDELLSVVGPYITKSIAMRNAILDQMQLKWQAHTNSNKYNLYCEMVQISCRFKYIRYNITLTQISTIINTTSRLYCLPYVITTTASSLLTLVHKDDRVMEVCCKTRLWEFVLKGRN